MRDQPATCRRLQDRPSRAGLRISAWLGAVQITTSRRSHEKPGAERSGRSEGALRSANVERQIEWCDKEIPDLSFRGNELAGEVGEACNVIKKLERERRGWCGSRDTLEHLAEELADVIITADLVAIQFGIDLGAAVAAKFNATTIKNGLATRMAGRAAAAEGVPEKPCEQSGSNSGNEKVQRPPI